MAFGTGCGPRELLIFPHQIPLSSSQISRQKLGTSRVLTKNGWQTTEVGVDTVSSIDQSQHQLPIPQGGVLGRIAFRFCFIYFGGYCLFTQIATSLLPLPKIDIPDLSTFFPMRHIVQWTAVHIFRLAQRPSFAETGSGDRTFDCVLVFCLLVIAGTGTIIWSVLDRHRLNYVTLHKWFRLIVRFCLAGQMITYGFSKVIPLQMPFPYLTRLLTPYGNFSPMGVLWSSIGASTSYEIFAGCAELLGGILLLLPRTTTIGALVCMADMTQVFALNMTYDVPVKNLSFHLFLIAFFLVSPDLKRLINFFFLNRTAEPSTQLPVFARPRANRIALIAQLIFGLWLLVMNAYVDYLNWYEYGDGRTKSPLYGIWEVDRQTIDGQFRSPLLTDSGRWRRVIFDFPSRVAFQRIDDSFARYGASIDVNAKTMALTSDTDKNWKGAYTFDRPAADQLVLDGEVDGHRTHLQLRLVDIRSFLLVSRGFHWIQEGPFNR
jgi:uncharacterized membrane protein YphA (DoxX/SURF4 family)